MKGFLRDGKESDAAAERNERNDRENREHEEVVEQIPTDVSSDELREFLELDGLDVSADPAFKERLRRKLWDMVQRRARGESVDDEV